VFARQYGGRAGGADDLREVSQQIYRTPLQNLEIEQTWSWNNMKLIRKRKT
jgi:hypothetical protein